MGEQMGTVTISIVKRVEPFLLSAEDSLPGSELCSTTWFEPVWLYSKLKFGTEYSVQHTFGAIIYHPPNLVEYLEYPVACFQQI
jgi:hypothetical protein